MKFSRLNFFFRITCGVILASAPLTVSAQSFTQKTNLPTLYIETENHEAITSKETYIKATLRYVDAGGEKYYDALSISGRGNSTWGMAKKPYRIKFDKKQEFLGPDHAKAKSWTLLANFADKSLMRNALASEVAKFAGQPFAAAAQFVDLVLNGEYLGNYQISDQVEIRPKRVDIVEQADPITDASNFTGGYLLEVDGFADYEPCWIRTSRGVKITVKSPDDDIIHARQVNYIKNYIQSFEDALFSEDFTNPATGYRRYVDESTLISWYVASEMTANPDAFWSTYIYKNRDDPKIYWGPLWDYDIAFNNSQRAGDMTRHMVLRNGFGGDLTGVWVRRMWEDPWFVNAVNEKWKEMVAAGLQEHLLKFIDEKEDELKASEALDIKLWPIYQRVYDEYKLFYSYPATVDFLREFVKGHISYLTEVFEKEVTYAAAPPFELDENHYYRIHNAATMKCADVTADGSAVCGNTSVSGAASQQWVIRSAGNGYYTIENRATGKAVADMAPFNGSTYQRGSQIGLADADAASARQEWEFVPMPSGGAYVIANRATGFAWNNSQGSSADGNPFLSWENDANNPSKATRHWRIIRDEARGPSGIDSIAEDSSDCVVSYSQSDAIIRFLISGKAPLEGSFTITDIAGRTMKSGEIAQAVDECGGVDISSLPAGIYILSWETSGRRGSFKLIKK